MVDMELYYGGHCHANEEGEEVMNQTLTPDQALTLIMIVVVMSFVVGVVIGRASK